MWPSKQKPVGEMAEVYLDELVSLLVIIMLGVATLYFFGRVIIENLGG